MIDRTKTQFSVLVVDDQPANLRLLSGMLKERGYRVRPMPNGRLALEAAKESPPDLVMLDVKMPGMDGYEVCRRFKANQALCDIPVIFISALSEPVDKVRAFECGAVDYVTKPFQIDEVSARIDTHLEIRSLQRELAGQNQTLHDNYNRLRQLEATRDNLVHMVVHDLRSPLMGVMGYVQLLERMSENNGDERCRTYAAKALLGAGALREMIDTMLAVHRLESEDMPLDVASHRLSGIVEEAVEVLGGPGDGPSIVIDLTDEPSVRCDAGLVRRVITNLVANAIKHNPADAPVRVSSEFDGEGVRVSVRDSGPGIPRDQQSAIFDKFHSGEREPVANGLGLAFCKLAVEAHGGTIGVDSEPGQGSTFWFRIPRTGTDADFGEGRTTVTHATIRPPVALRLPASTSEERLTRTLVVDDDRLTLELMVSMLRDVGVHAVDLATSGEEALAVFDERRGEFDLIISDIRMPGMDGVEFLRHLRQRRFGGAVAVVSGVEVRALQGAENLARAHGLNVIGSFAKPIGPAALADLICRMGTLNARMALPASHCAADELATAIRRGELVVHYQPKVDVVTERLVGVEALVRWDRPGRGFVGPGSFIAVAEQAGLIDELTDVVVRQAFRAAGRMRDESLDLDMAINVSVDTLASLDFPDRLVDAAIDERIAPSRVTIEVTEGRVMQNQSVSLEVLNRLNLKGFKLSIDDFGTGYSSLSQLRRIPFSELKIDRTFISGMSRDAGGRAVVESSVDLARKLGMRVVAEGVETREDWEAAARAGCDLAQGYFLSRPRPEDDFLRFAEQWNQPLHAGTESR